MSWPSVPFTETIRKTSVGRKNQIPASEIRSAGHFPVIDQGKSFIAGYSDDESRLITRDLPLVIFGDHTRVVKFVDFPFILGADGTKVLKPREDDFDARFFAFALQSLNLPSRGYNRHFTLLRDMRVFRPELAEQRKIASVLELVSRAIDQQERLLALTVELKQCVLQQLFSYGLRPERQKQTELRPVPEGWEVVPLRICAHVQTGIAKGRKLSGELTLTLPYLRVANVQSGFLDLADIKTITIRERERDRYLLHDGDVVLTEGGDFDKLGRGFIWQSEVPECVHQNHIFAVRVDRSRLMPEFFAHLSQSPYGKAYFLSVAHKTTNLACINTTKLKGFPVLIPKMKEQAEIVEVLSAVDAKIQHHRIKQATLKELFRTLLYELMTARIRISNLDLRILRNTLLGTPALKK